MYVSDIAADEAVVAIHFRPGGAFPFLGTALGEFENRRIGLDEAWGRAGQELHERLIALFRAEIGLSPKEYARVRRFQPALRKMSSPAASGARVAAELGYYDQAHSSASSGRSRA